MKKIFVFIAIMACTISLTHAQDSTGNHKAKMEKMKKMRSELNLTSEQKAVVKEQNAAFKEKAVSIKDDKSLGKKEKRQKMMDLQKERNDKMSTVLSEDQMKKMKDMHKKSPNKGGPRKSATGNQP